MCDRSFCPTLLAGLGLALLVAAGPLSAEDEALRTALAPEGHRGKITADWLSE